MAPNSSPGKFAIGRVKKPSGLESRDEADMRPIFAKSQSARIGSQNCGECIRCDAFRCFTDDARYVRPKALVVASR